MEQQKTNGRLIDFYLSADVSGNGKREIEKILKKHEDARVVEYKITEKNYGRGADWPVELIEVLVSDEVVATLSLYEILKITKEITSYLIKSLKKVRGREPQEPKFYLGKVSAAAYAAEFVASQINQTDLKLIKVIELERGGAFSEKEYLVLLTIQTGINDSKYQDPNKDDSFSQPVFIVRIGWQGEISHFLRY